MTELSKNSSINDQIIFTLNKYISLSEKQLDDLLKLQLLNKEPQICTS